MQLLKKVQANQDQTATQPKYQMREASHRSDGVSSLQCSIAVSTGEQQARQFSGHRGRLTSLQSGPRRYLCVSGHSNREHVFLNRAMDLQQLMNAYCVVIMDEAHE